MYLFYLGGLLLPVAPEKVVWKTEGQNRQFQMVNMEQYAKINPMQLTKIQFQAIFPGIRTPFYGQGGAVEEPFFLLEQLKAMATAQKAVLFQVVRDKLPYERSRQVTQMMVTVEQFTVTEEASSGYDLVVDIVLREYQEAKTKRMEQQGEVKKEERSSEREVPTSYTVKSGDTLWGICKTRLNDGSRCYEVAKKNGITNPNLIYPGQVILFE